MDNPLAEAFGASPPVVNCYIRAIQKLPRHKNVSRTTMFRSRPHPEWRLRAHPIGSPQAVFHSLSIPTV